MNIEDDFTDRPNPEPEPPEPPQGEPADPPSDGGDIYTDP